jgi:hypothetical protein
VKGETEFLILDPSCSFVESLQQAVYHCQPGEEHNCTFAVARAPKQPPKGKTVLVFTCFP